MGERVVSLVVTFTIPLLIWLFLYYLATYRRVAMKPLRPWLIVTSIALFAVSLFYDVGNNPRVSNLLRVGAWSAWTILLWINRRAMFASVGTGWYKWRRGSLMIPRGIHIPVESVATLSPWYTEKLGLRRMTSVPEYEGAGSVGYKFNEDGMPIILTPSDKRKTQRTPIFFTKKIEKMRDI